MEITYKNDQHNLGLKYQGYAIVFQEVPDEVTLAFNISGCQYKCVGCHSKHLWEYKGRYVLDDIDDILSKNKDYITCVCFMGGDQNIKELYKLCKIVKKVYGLKVCIYSGADNIIPFDDLLNEELIDYLKVGKYDHSKGGLDKVTTNQKMYKVLDKCRLENINKRFYKTKM